VLVGTTPAPDGEGEDGRADPDPPESTTMDTATVIAHTIEIGRAREMRPFM
jgi:hypothetical protein